MKSDRETGGGNDLKVLENQPTKAMPASWLVPSIVALGIGLRIIQWVWNTSYFHDEICLLWNITRRSFSQYLGPLDNNQSAPALFMYIERMVLRISGTEAERIMRLPALGSAVLAIICFVFLARRLLRPWEVVLAVWLFACSEKLSYFGAMLKPYSGDVLIAILLTWMALEIERTRSILGWLMLSGVALAAVWLSYPAIIVFGGISAALAVRFLGRSLPRTTVYLLGNLAVGIAFLFIMRRVESAQHTHMMDVYWGRNFVDYSRPARIPFWFLNVLYKLGNFDLKWGGLYLLPLAVLGFISLVRGRRLVVAAILVGPLALNLAAAALHRFPFGERVTLYLIVSVFLLSAVGTGALYDWLWPRLKSHAVMWSLSPAVVVAMIALGAAIENAINPYVITDYRPMVQAVRAQAGNDDLIYSPFVAEFLYYWPGLGHRVRCGVPGYADEMSSHRFWLVWSRPRPQDLQDLNAMRRWAETFATARSSYVRSGNYAYLYEVTSPPPHIRCPTPSVETVVPGKR